MKMFTIVNKQVLGENIKRIDIYARNISEKIFPGQFVMIVAKENEEWLSLSVIEKDTRKGTIALIFKEETSALKRLGSLSINDSLYAIMGPMGQPANIKKYGTVICVADGLGIAQILPICRALRKQENRVIGVFGARAEKDMILDTQMRITCNKFILCTEEGYKNKGNVGDAINQLLSKEKVKCVYAIGSDQLIEEVISLTRVKSIKTLIQLNPKMYCATGQCGSCRVKVDGRIVLSCLEGKEFDGHKVDYPFYKKRCDAYSSDGLALAADGNGEKNIVVQPFIKIFESMMKES